MRSEVISWWQDRVKLRLQEKTGRWRELELIKFEDVKERLDLYYMQWVEIEKPLRVLYFKDLNQGVVEAISDLPVEAEIQPRGIDEAHTYITHHGFEFGDFDYDQFWWALLAVRLHVGQNVFGHNVTFLPKAASVIQPGLVAEGYGALLEVMYAIEPEMFEVIESVQSIIKMGEMLTEESLAISTGFF